MNQMQVLFFFKVFIVYFDAICFNYTACNNVNLLTLDAYMACF